MSGSDVHRERELPDSAHTEMNGSISEEDMLRTQLYGLLARSLAEPPSDETLEILRGLADADDGTEFCPIDQLVF